MSLLTVQKIWLLVGALVLVESCTLSGESGPYPWTVRVTDSNNVTITHGSMIRADKVLTICSPYKDLPVNVLSKGYMMVGYNFKEDCESTKKAKTIVMAPNCSLASDIRWPLVEDFALWTLLEFFQIDDNSPPYLWGEPNPPLPGKIRAVIDFLSTAPESEKLKIGLFKNPTNGSELQTGAEIGFISWKNCKKDILMKLDKQVHDVNTWAQSVDGMKDAASEEDQVPYEFFCGTDEQITWNPGANNSTSQPEFDWYSGAAVVFEDQPPPNGRRMAIGMLSRAFTVDPLLAPGQHNFRLISGFHQGLYMLLKKSAIVPLDHGGDDTTTMTPPDNSTEPPPTATPVHAITDYPTLPRRSTKAKPASFAGQPPSASSLRMHVFGLACYLAYC